MTILLTEVIADGSGAGIDVSRVDLAKRRWRGVAQDGSNVAVDLEAPAKDGDWLSGDGGCFQVRQLPEEVVAIPLPRDVSMGAKIGWYLGNRHIPIEVREHEMVMENFPTLTDSLKRIGIVHEVRQDVLRCKAHSSDHRH